MKKLGFYLGVVTCIYALVIMGCAEKKESAPAKDFSDDYKKHKISLAIEDTLIKTYLKNNYAKINQKGKPLDTREVCHELNVLRGYFQYVEAEAGKKNIKPEEIGIKIMFGQYPKNYEIPGSDPKYKDHQTVLLKPFYLKDSTVSKNTAPQKMSLLNDTDPLSDVEALDVGNLKPPY